MSKLHQPHGRADADPAKGELRKPDDYSDQPGQHPDAEGTSPREYGHSSGDRNTKSDDDDWPGFDGGVQRDAAVDAPPTTPAKPEKR